MQEFQERGQLHSQGEGCYQYDKEAIYDTFGDYRAQRFRKRRAVLAFQYTTTRHLAHTGYYQAGSVGYKDAINTCPQPWMFSYGFQGEFPPARTEGLGGNAEHQGEQHPFPLHFLSYPLPKLAPVRAAIHPPEDTEAQDKGKQNFQYFFDGFQTISEQYFLVILQTIANFEY